jgi:short-subunit dehydrogenase
MKKKKVKNILVVISGTKKGLGKAIYKEIIKLNQNILIINRPKNDLIKGEKVVNFLKRNVKIRKATEIVFINNAFVVGEIKKIGNLSIDKIKNSILSNILSYYFICNFLTSLKFKKIKIINITSGAAFTFKKKISLYSCCKLFNHKLTEFVSKENPRIKTFNFDPGIFKSDMNRIFVMKKILNRKKAKKAENVAIEILKKINLKNEA